MSHQVDTSIKANRAEFRAYLLYDGGKVVISPDGKSYTAYVSLKNFGQTPAYNTTHWINSIKMNQPQEPFSVAWNEGMRDTGRWPTVDVGSNQSICVSEAFPANGSLDGKVLYVWGVVKYRDRYTKCQLEMFEVRTNGTIKNGQTVELVGSFNEATDYGGDRWDQPDRDKCAEYTPGVGDYRMPLSKAFGTEELPADPAPKSIVSQGTGCPTENK